MKKRLFFHVIVVTVMIALLTGCVTDAPSETKQTAASPEASASPAPTVEDTGIILPSPTNTNSDPSDETLPIGSLPQFAQAKRPYDACVLNVPEIHRIEEYDFSEEIIAITYRGADYKGKETRVFAFLGVPKEAGKDNPCPAVVLAHGGGGTADAYWVKYWVDRGYAAISMDLEGHYPIDKGSHFLPETKKNDYSGPIRNGAFADGGTSDLSKQWTYHAVTDIMLARSILGGMPEVRNDAVGIMGFSWGGYLTSFVIGVDNRFAFAVPVYVSDYLAEMYSYFGDAVKGAGAKWDPTLNISNITAKVLWFNSDKDDHFTENGTSLSYENTPGSILLLDPNLAHGGGNCWSRPEQFIFADSVTRGTKGLIEIAEQPSGLNPVVKYVIPEGISVHSAVVYYRDKEMGKHNVNKTQWKSMDCTVDAANNSVSVSLPDDTVAYYINIYDERTETDLFMNRAERIGSSTKVVYID